MKRLLISILFLISISSLVIFYTVSSSYYKVTEIVSPSEVFIDFNKNLIYDEEKPFVIENIYYIDEDKNYSDDNILKNLTLDDKIFLSYQSKKISENLLKNRFVKVENGNIFVKGKNYKQILVKSGYFYTDDDNSKHKLVDYVKHINLDDYVIYNYRTGKVHKLSCEKGRSGKKFVIVKKSEIRNEFTECPFCFGTAKQNKHKQDKQFSKTKKPIVKKDYFYIPKSSGSKPSTVYKEENLKVYFIDLNDIYKPSSACKNIACSDLSRLINQSASSIDFAVYGIDRQPVISDALINVQNRGVRLRWVIDFDKKEENYYKDTISLKRKITNHVTDEECDNSSRSAIMHNKFFVFDGKKVWTGSANISNTGLSGFNSNLVVLIDSAPLADIYTKEFDQMYNGSFHTKKSKIKKDFIKVNSETSVLPLFSPSDNVINYIISEISKAKSYIYIPIFFITHKDLISPLIEAHNRGVDVKIIDDATNAHNKYSIHKALREAGIKVKTENYAGKMHMKTLIIDDKTSIIGSMNFTKSGNIRNDENVLIIKSVPLTKYLKSVFLYLWSKIPDKYENFDPSPESKYSVGSCDDGVDNDFDGKIDSADEGCSYKSQK